MLCARAAGSHTLAAALSLAFTRAARLVFGLTRRLSFGLTLSLLLHLALLCAGIVGRLLCALLNLLLESLLVQSGIFGMYDGALRQSDQAKSENGKLIFGKHVEGLFAVSDEKKLVPPTGAASAARPTGRMPCVHAGCAFRVLAVASLIALSVASVLAFGLRVSAATLFMRRGRSRHPCAGGSRGGALLAGLLDSLLDLLLQALHVDAFVRAPGGKGDEHQKQCGQVFHGHERIN